jgi:hypothetical protein
MNTLRVNNQNVPIHGAGDVNHFSLGKYRHDAGFARHQQQVEGVRRNSEWYDHVIANIPTRKTTDFDELCVALRYRLHYVDDLYNFCTTRSISSGASRPRSGPSARLT